MKISNTATGRKNPKRKESLRIDVNGFLMEHFSGNWCIYWLVAVCWATNDDYRLSIGCTLGVIRFKWVISIPPLDNQSPPSSIFLRSNRKRFTWKETISDRPFDIVAPSVCAAIIISFSLFFSFSFPRLFSKPKPHSYNQIIMMINPAIIWFLNDLIGLNRMKREETGASGTLSITESILGT